MWKKTWFFIRVDMCLSSSFWSLFCFHHVLKLHPQIFTMLWTWGIITLQEPGSTTDTQLRHVTTLLPASTQHPGATPKTGNNIVNCTPNTSKLSLNVREKNAANQVLRLLCILLAPITCQQLRSLLFIFPSHCFRVRHHDDLMNDSMAQGSVSVNVPQFFVPPVEGVSQVSVMNLGSARPEASVSHPHEKRRTISLPADCREPLYYSQSWGRCSCFGSVKK